MTNTPIQGSQAETIIAEAVHHEEAPGQLYVMFTQLDDMLHIRKWAKDREFDGATLYVNTGSGAPLGPLDASEHLPVDQLPAGLRFVAEHLWLECEPHVIQDCVRIVLDAAAVIEAAQGHGAEHESPVGNADAPGA